MSPTKASLSRFNPSLLPPKSKSAANSPVRARLFDQARRKTSNAVPLTTSTDVTENLTEGLTETLDITPSKTGRGGNNRAAAEEEVEEEEDDLPETPQKLLDTPEFKDTPPRGILYSSRERGKRKRDAETVAGSEAILESGGPDPEEEPEPDRVDSVAESETGLDDTNADVQGNTEADIELARSTEEKLTELERLKSKIRSQDHQLRLTEKHINLVTSIAPGKPYKDIQELLSLTAPPPSTKSLPKPPTINSLLNAFLPFSLPTPQVADQFDPSTLASHHPLPPTPELLGLFSPLALTTSISVPASTGSTIFSQLHTLKLSSPHALLTATIEMTVLSSHDESPKIENLHIRHISPWVSHEIGTWLTETAQTGDLPSIGHALGRYWEISVSRARAWTRVCRQFGSLMSPPMTATKNGISADGPITVQDLTPHLGRISLRLKDDHVDLKLCWALEVDWAGDLLSKVGARGTFPVICKFLPILIVETILIWTRRA
jgi:hypothetical protein